MNVLDWVFIDCSPFVVGDSDFFVYAFPIAHMISPYVDDVKQSSEEKLRGAPDGK